MIDPQELGLDVVSVSGAEARCFCPFHDDRHPSASFNIMKGMFNCFVCGGYPAGAVARYLGGRIVHSSHLRINKRREPEEWRHILAMPLAIDNEYLRSRGITNADIETYKIRQSPPLFQRDKESGKRDGRNGEKNKGVVYFPLTNRRGQTVGYMSRRFGSDSSRTNRYMVYGKKPALWPLGDLHNHKRAYLVEGHFAAIKARAAGFPTFATMGTGAIGRALEFLHGRHIVTLMDRDFAGALASAKALLTIQAPYILEYDTKRDVDEFSASNFREILRKSNERRDLSYVRAISDDKRRFNTLLSKWTGNKAIKYMR